MYYIINFRVVLLAVVLDHLQHVLHLHIYMEASSPRVDGDTAILSTAQSKLAGTSHILSLNFIQCSHFFFSWRDTLLVKFL
jgi:hypothetical protein